jgi:hypothetical protein
MNKISAKEARRLSDLFASECTVQLNAVMNAIRMHALKGQYTFVYSGTICEKAVDELKELGYNIAKGDDDAYENFWYIKW